MHKNRHSVDVWFPDESFVTVKVSSKDQRDAVIRAAIKAKTPSKGTPKLTLKKRGSSVTARELQEEYSMKLKLEDGSLRPVEENESPWKLLDRTTGKRRLVLCKPPPPIAEPQTTGPVEPASGVLSPEFFNTPQSPQLEVSPRPPFEEHVEIVQAAPVQTMTIPLSRVLALNGALNASQDGVNHLLGSNTWLLQVPQLVKWKNERDALDVACAHREAQNQRAYLVEKALRAANAPIVNRQNKPKTNNHNARRKR